MKKFLTHQEMKQRYIELRSLPNDGHPFYITLDSPKRYFGFIGTMHVSDPAHFQWERYYEEWQRFVGSPNTNKLVLYEGNAEAPDVATKEEAIKKGADNRLTAWLSLKNGIVSFSPEPDRSLEIVELKKLGFKEDEITIYYVGRQIGQWLDRDKQYYPDLDEYVAMSLKYTSVQGWDKQYTSKEARQLLEVHFGNIKLEDAPRSAFSNIADPSLNSVSSACSEIRDRSIFASLESAWHDGKDVFCAYGSGHAIVMEPALRELIGSSEA